MLKLHNLDYLTSAIVVVNQKKPMPGLSVRQIKKFVPLFRMSFESYATPNPPVRSIERHCV